MHIGEGRSGSERGVEVGTVGSRKEREVFRVSAARAMNRDEAASPTPENTPAIFRITIDQCISKGMIIAPHDLPAFHCRSHLTLGTSEIYQMAEAGMVHGRYSYPPFPNSQHCFIGTLLRHDYCTILVE